VLLKPVIEFGPSGTCWNAKMSSPLPPVRTCEPPLPNRTSLPPPPLSDLLPLVAIRMSSTPVPVSEVALVALFATVAVAALLLTAMPSLTL